MNYPHLNNYEQIVKCFIFRNLKDDNAKKEIEYVIDNINRTISITDDLIEDVIKLILDYSDLTERKLISDVNSYIEYIKTTSWMRSDNLYEKISNHTDLVKYIRHRMTLFTLLTRPIAYLFNWNSTRRGVHYYERLSKKINKILTTNDFIDKIFNLESYD